MRSRLAMSLVGSLFPLAVAASASATPSESAHSNATQTSSSDISMITIDVEAYEYSLYHLRLTDDNNNVITVAMDYLQSEVWLMDANKMLDCSLVSSVYDEYSWSDVPSSYTYSGTTYNINMCYLYGAETTTTTYTVVSDSSTVTFTESTPTESPYTLSYAFGSYASGNLLNSNFSIGIVSDDNEVSLSISNLQYLFVEDTNLVAGGIGLANNPNGEGILQLLKDQKLIEGLGYSTYFYSNSSNSTTDGYLLLGSVDQKLYTGDFYSFPEIPHEGWGSDSAIYPIVQVDNINLENLNTSKEVNLYSDSFAAVIDPSLTFSYLPEDMIINLALQTNAYYNSDDATWIVRCSNMDNADALITFDIGPLTVDVPLESIKLNLASENLTFPGGDPVCSLNIRSSDTLGYPAFGSTFLQHIYMAMDNEGGQIALAKANTDLHSDTLTSHVTSAVNSSSTVGLISSGYIPFATNTSFAGSLTFTFSPPNSTMQASVPARFTNVQIVSGQVLTSSLSASNSASAADANSSSGGSGLFRINHTKEGSYILYWLLLIGGLMGVAFV